jgi:type II secretory pathway predicted ATPase ExeA
MVSMRAEVMEFYGLTRSPRAVGYFETTHHRQLLQDIKQAVYDGDLVALCGVVGAGKTVMLRRLQDLLARENRVIVAKSISVEKSRPRWVTLREPIIDSAMRFGSAALATERVERNAILAADVAG